MRATYGIFLEIPLKESLPGFWEGIKDFEFCAGLDAGNFRVRQEISRIEVEDVTDGNRARVEQVLLRAAHQMFVPTLRACLERPELTAADAQKIASVSIAPVQDAPNPAWTHGLAGSNSAVRCPKCDAPMTRRMGNRGRPFYGCNNYPACTGSRSISE